MPCTPSTVTPTTSPGRGAHYLHTVKRNQPGLHRQLAALPWAEVPAGHLTRGKGHDRAESRTVKLVAVTAGIGFPHARPRSRSPAAAGR